jgi:hypothetical protein
MIPAITIALTLDEDATAMVATAIEVRTGGWRRYPISTESLSPDFHEADKWLAAHGADHRPELGGFGLFMPGRRGLVLVDVSNRIYGLPFAEVIRNCKGMRQWGTQLGCVSEVEGDVVIPQWDGVRVKIGRGALISSLAQATRTRLLRFGRGEADLVREWDSYNRGTAAGEKQAPPRIQALKLAAWGAEDFWRRGEAARRALPA